MGRRVAKKASANGKGDPGKSPAHPRPHDRRSAARSNESAARVLAGIVFIAGDKILLVLSRKDQQACFGRWSIPKGKYQEDADEGLFATAARELKEETGIDLTRLGKRGVGESDCVDKGMLRYGRKGRMIELHYFVIDSQGVVLDSSSTAGEPMVGVGFFAHPLAAQLIRREQKPLLRRLMPEQSK